MAPPNPSTALACHCDSVTLASSTSLESSTIWKTRKPRSGTPPKSSGLRHRNVAEPPVVVTTARSSGAVGGVGAVVDTDVSTNDDMGKHDGRLWAATDTATSVLFGKSRIVNDPLSSAGLPSTATSRAPVVDPSYLTTYRSTGVPPVSKGLSHASVMLPPVAATDRRLLGGNEAWTSSVVIPPTVVAAPSPATLTATTSTS